MNSSVTVIIPAKNEEKHISYCLEAIKNQIKKPVECIVVDNGSVDNTRKIAVSYGAKILFLLNVTVGGLRNAGADIAKGNILAFLDADCVPESDWLKNSVDIIQNKGIGACGSSVLPSNGNNWIEKTWFLNIKTASGNVRYIGSANLILRKKVFKLTGGFNPDLSSGEDRELSWKIQKAGFKIICDERIRVKHLGYPKTIRSFYKRELWHGKSIVSDFANPLKSRMLYVLIFLTVLLFFSIISISLKYYTFSLLLIIVFPVSISTLKCLNKKNFKIIGSLSALYFIYFAARLIAFYNTIIIVLIKKLKKYFVKIIGA